MNEIIASDIPKITPEHFPEQALAWMDDYKISHIPYFVKGEYSMLLTESQLLDLKPMLPIGQQIKNTIFVPYCTDNQHILEIISIFAKNKLSLLPVFSVEKKYLGVILADELFFEFGKKFSNFQGAIIKLEVSLKDYTVAQIAQIVESNDVKIVQLFSELNSDFECYDITLSLQGDRIQGVIQTFVRYGYNVKEVYGQQNDDPTGMKDRYDSLLNFLNL